MESTKHTPGPWTAEQRDHTHMNIHAQGSHVAAVVRYATSDPGNRKFTRGGSEVGAANARLIAAAPDSLGTLRAILEWTESRDGDARTDENIIGTIGQMARAAIAKATGQQ